MRKVKKKKNRNSILKSSERNKRKSFLRTNETHVFVEGNFYGKVSTDFLKFNFLKKRILGSRRGRGNPKIASSHFLKSDMDLVNVTASKLFFYLFTYYSRSFDFFLLYRNLYILYRNGYFVAKEKSQTSFSTHHWTLFLSGSWYSIDNVLIDKILLAYLTLKNDKLKPIYLKGRL